MTLRTFVLIFALCGLAFPATAQDDIAELHLEAVRAAIAVVSAEEARASVPSATSDLLACQAAFEASQSNAALITNLEAAVGVAEGEDRTTFEAALAAARTKATALATLQTQACDAYEAANNANVEAVTAVEAAHDAHTQALQEFLEAVRAEDVDLLSGRINALSERMNALSTLFGNADGALEAAIAAMHEYMCSGGVWPFAPFCQQ